MKAIPMKAQAALARFEAAREALAAFSKDNSDVVEEYNLLRGAFNAAIDEMKAIYKDNFDVLGPKYGDFKAVVKTELSAEALMEALGQASGPYIVTKHSVNRKEYIKAVENGLISSEVVASVETQSSPIIYGPPRAE